MVLCDVVYGEKCPNYDKKAKYDVCNGCKYRVSLYKTFAQCHLETNRENIKQA